MVRGALACFDLQPSDLELEITESTAMQNPELTIRVLDQLAGLGIILAIDDFGTGYSSLAYPQHLPIQRLKLDRSFVRTSKPTPAMRRSVSATVALGHNLGLELVAEGVETAAQRDFLAKLGCDVLQGFLYSRPLPRGRNSGLSGNRAFAGHRGRFRHLTGPPAGLAGAVGSALHPPPLGLEIAHQNLVVAG